MNTFIGRKTIRHLLIMFGVVLAGNWQFTFSLFLLKWDALMVSFPWRYFLGHSLQNSELPTWLPYHTLGHPFYIDAQSWYPVSWFIGWAFGYNAFSFHFEYLLHLVVAAWGMYWLVKENRIPSNIAVAAGIVYSFSGFFVANAQHVAAIVSAAWLPFVLMALLQLVRAPSAIKALTLAVFTYLLLSGGYPQFIFATFIVSTAIVLSGLVLKLRRSEKREAMNLLLYSVLSAVLFLSCAIFFLLVLYEAIPHFLRGSGLTYEQVIRGGPFTPQSLLSLLFPYASVVEPSFWKTDVAFANGYMGLLVLLLLLLFPLEKRSLLMWGWFVCGLFFLILSLGDSTPFFKLFYEYVPFGGHFRMLGFYRLFFLVPFIICASHVLAGIRFINIAKFKAGAIILLTTIAAIVVFIYFSFDTQTIVLKRILMSDQIHDVSLVWQHIIVQSPVQILVLLLFLYILKNPVKNLNWLLCLIIVEVIFAFQLNAPFTQYHRSMEQNQRTLFANMKLVPENFPLPAMNPIGTPLPKPNLAPLWSNQGVYSKQPEYHGYNPYLLRNFHMFDTSMYKATTLQQPVFFLANGLAPIGGTIEAVSGYAYLNPNDLAVVENQVEGVSKGDTIIPIEFVPGRFKLMVRNQKPVFLVVIQNHFPGWKAKVNGNETGIYPVQYALMGIVVPSGENEIVFEHKPPKVVIGYILSLILFLIYVVILLIYNVKQSKLKHTWLSGTESGEV